MQEIWLNGTNIVIEVTSRLYLQNHRRHYSAFFNYHKAFRTVNHIALWQNMLKSNIDGKVFRVVFDKHSTDKA